jgi:hypothetical protein
MRIAACSNADPNCVRCTLDGFEHDCGHATQLIENGAAAQCPDNDCGPRHGGDSNVHEDPNWRRNRGARGGSFNHGFSKSGFAGPVIGGAGYNSGLKASITATITETVNVPISFDDNTLLVLTLNSLLATSIQERGKLLRGDKLETFKTAQSAALAKFGFRAGAKDPLAECLNYLKTRGFHFPLNDLVKEIQNMVAYDAFLSTNNAYAENIIDRDDGSSVSEVFQRETALIAFSARTGVYFSFRASKAGSLVTTVIHEALHRASKLKDEQLASSHFNFYTESGTRRYSGSPSTWISIQLAENGCK